MDIIFQLAGSLLLCFYISTRGNKNFIAQNYSEISNGKFDYERTYSSIKEVYLTRIGVLNITIGYILTFIKAPNFLELLSKDYLEFYVLSILSIILLLAINLFIVKKISTRKTLAISTQFDYNKNMVKNKWHLYVEE